MTWFRVDDGFARHRKVRALREFGARIRADAIALWLLAGLDCAAALGEGGTVDGAISNADLATIAHPMTRSAIGFAASALVHVGLWHKTAEGYAFHDWNNYQPTSQSVKDKREKWRVDKAGQRGGQPPMSTSDTAKDTTPDSTVDSGESPSRARARVPAPSPSPSRPDPGESESLTRARAAFGPLGPEIARLQAHVRRELKPKGANPSDLTSSRWTVIAEWCRSMSTAELSVDEVQRRLASGFAADAGKTAREGWPLSHLATNPSQFYAKVEGRTGYVRPDSVEHEATTDDDFERALRGGVA